MKNKKICPTTCHFFPFQKSTKHKERPHTRVFQDQNPIHILRLFVQRQGFTMIVRKHPRSSSLPWFQRSIPGLTIGSAMVLWIASTTLIPLAFVSELPNTLGISLLFFNNLNILIALCEIVLGYHIRFIQKNYLQLKERYDGQGKRAIVPFLLTPLSVVDLFGGEKWAAMWSTYSLWDPSYQNNESFGFFIDVGNGWSTIPPCIIWNAAILFPQQVQDIWVHSNLFIGMIGCCSYWQVMYGTIIYFLSFIFNGRYRPFPMSEVLAFVGTANGIWFFFPIAALYAATLILMGQDLKVVFGWQEWLGDFFIFIGRLPFNIHFTFAVVPCYCDFWIL